MISDFFIVFGSIIFLGFIADILFERIKISNVVILMILGFIIGPLLGIADVSEGSVIKDIYPIVGALAFIVILFDAGTKTNINRMLKTAPKATVFTILVFLLTVIILSLILYYIFSWEILYAILFSGVVGGISSPIVITMVKKLPLSNEIKYSLSYESTLTDVLCVLTAVIVMQIIIEGGAAVTPNDILSYFVSTFSVSIVLGGIAAMLWIFTLSKLPKHSFYYMLTMATVFLLYSITEYSAGNGAIAVFIFGLVIGHVKELESYVKVDEQYLIDNKFLKFQDEVTFFVRTFFFVYIGLLLSPSQVNFITVYYSLLVLGVAIVARGIGKMVMYPKVKGTDEIILNSMVPRGLAAAVLASYPLTQGLYIPNFEETVFMVILITNLFPSIIIFLFGKDLNKIEEKQNNKGKDTVKTKQNK
ncbi:cation:proton antiporter [Candidatus Micrarchaeota archaeon]|nr:cation:proton antiporter [Candidatus Micrarchaeota archaeon]